MSKLLRLISILAVFLVAGRIACAGNEHTSVTQPILGTWLVEGSFTPADGSAPFKVLFTFFPGRNINEGTLTDTNEFQLTGNPVCTPDQGVWRRVSPGKYIATHLNFCFDVKKKDSPPDGPTKIWDTITFQGGDRFDGLQYIEGYDNSGKVVFSAHVTLHGTRVHAETSPH